MVQSFAFVACNLFARNFKLQKFSYFAQSGLQYADHVYMFLINQVRTYSMMVISGLYQTVVRRLVHRDDWKCTITLNGERFALISLEQRKLLLLVGSLVLLLMQTTVSLEHLGMSLYKILHVKKGGGRDNEVGVSTRHYGSY